MKKKWLVGLVIIVIVLAQIACAGGGAGWNGEESECAQEAAEAGYEDFETRVVGGNCQVCAGQTPGRDIWVNLTDMP